MKNSLRFRAQGNVHLNSITLGFSIVALIIVYAAAIRGANYENTIIEQLELNDAKSDFTLTVISKQWRIFDSNAVYSIEVNDRKTHLRQKYIVDIKNNTITFTPPLPLRR